MMETPKLRIFQSPQNPVFELIWNHSENVISYNFTVQNISQEDKATTNTQADAQYAAGPTTDTHHNAQTEAILAEEQQQRILLSPQMDDDVANDRTSEETEQQPK
jgi:hypothetical protein